VFSLRYVLNSLILCRWASGFKWLKWLWLEDECYTQDGRNSVFQGFATALWQPTSQLVPGTLPRQWREADNSPSNAEIRNACSFPPFPIRLHCSTSVPLPWNVNVGENVWRAAGPADYVCRKVASTCSLTSNLVLYSIMFSLGEG